MNEQNHNPENWKLGLFYFNPGDRRLFLPKRNPAFGITLNFANPYSFLVIAAIIVLMAISAKAS